jgi:hypothetical protein
MEFVDGPPPSHGGSKFETQHDWRAIAEKLRGKPGQWVLIEDVHRNTAYLISKGGYAAFRDVGNWEATMRGSGTRRQLYLRYTGKKVK